MKLNLSKNVISELSSFLSQHDQTVKSLVGARAEADQRGKRVSVAETQLADLQGTASSDDDKALAQIGALSARLPLLRREASAAHDLTGEIAATLEPLKAPLVAAVAAALDAARESEVAACSAALRPHFRNDQAVLSIVIRADRVVHLWQLRERVTAFEGNRVLIAKLEDVVNLARKVAAGELSLDETRVPLPKETETVLLQHQPTPMELVTGATWPD